MVGVDAEPGPPDRLDPGERREAGVVALHQVGAVGAELVDPPDLRQRRGGLEIGEVRLPAGLDDVVVPERAGLRAPPRVAGDAVGPEQPQPLGHRRRAGRHDPALAAGEALGGIQREAREIADRPDLPAADGRLDGVGGVLDDRDLTAPHRRLDRIHVARATGEVHRHDRPGARRDRRLYEVGVDVQGAWIDVGEARRRARVEDRVHRRGPGERARDDLVARPHAGHAQGQVQRVGARRRGDRVLGAGVLGEALLELGHARARREPARLERLDHRVDLGAADDRRRELEQRLADGRAAVDGQVSGCAGAAHVISKRTAAASAAARASAASLGRAPGEHVPGPVGGDADGAVHVSRCIVEAGIRRPRRPHERARRGFEEPDHPGALGIRASCRLPPRAGRAPPAPPPRARSTPVASFTSSESWPPPRRAATSTIRGPSGPRMTWTYHGPASIPSAATARVAAFGRRRRVALRRVDVALGDPGRVVEVDAIGDRRHDAAALGGEAVHGHLRAGHERLVEDAPAARPRRRAERRRRPGPRRRAGSTSPAGPGGRAP